MGRGARTSGSGARRRWTTVFGWVGGCLAGLLVSLLLYDTVDLEVPMEPLTFGAVVLGAFGGMRLADRWGARAFGPLGIVAGVLVAATVAFGVSLVLG